VLLRFFGPIYFWQVCASPFLWFCFGSKEVALRQSIHTAILIGLHSVIFETDNKTLVNAINSTSAHNNEFGEIVAQCRVLLSNNLDYVVSHIRRQANRVAHTIA